MQSEIIPKLGQFLASTAGGIIVATLIGALGLFTWQRRDWVFKEQYHRNEVLTDRAVELIEKVNVETGTFLAQANDVIAAYQEQVSSAQLQEEIEGYNKRQALWFASNISDSALIGFYFPHEEMTQKFGAITQTTEELDRQIYLLSAGQKTPMEVHEVAERLRSLLEQWNTLALSNLP